MRNVGPLLAAIIIVLIAYAFVSATASAPFTLVQPGKSTGGLGTTGIQGSVGSSGQGTVIGDLKGCELQNRNITLNSHNKNPDISGSNVVYEYFNDVTGGCKCKFYGTGKFGMNRCTKQCAYYGTAGGTCMDDSSCKNANGKGSTDIFFQSLDDNFEVPVAMTQENELSPSIYGDKIVYFVDGKTSVKITETYDPQTNTKTIILSNSIDKKGKIMLFDIKTRKSMLVAETEITNDVHPRIYDDTIVWHDGEMQKKTLKKSYIEYYSDNYTDYEINIERTFNFERIVDNNIYAYNIPLARKTKLTDMEADSSDNEFSMIATSVAYGASISAITNVYGNIYDNMLFSGSGIGGGFLLGDDWMDWSITCDGIATASGGPVDALVTACITNTTDNSKKCAQSVPVKQGDMKIFFTANENKNPDIYGEKILYETVTNDRPQIAYYNMATKKTEILTTENDNILPKASGTKAIWTEKSGTKSTIVLYDFLTKETAKMSNMDGPNNYRDIDGNVVVWSENVMSPGPPPRLQGYSVVRNNTADPKRFSDRVAPLPPNPAWWNTYERSPAISGQNMVWEIDGDLWTKKCTDVTATSLKCDYDLNSAQAGVQYTTLTMALNGKASASFRAATYASCYGRLLQLKKVSAQSIGFARKPCDAADPVIAECVIPYPTSGSTVGIVGIKGVKADCTGSFKPPTIAGTYSYALCDPREGQASTVATLKVA